MSAHHNSVSVFLILLAMLQYGCAQPMAASEPGAASAPIVRISIGYYPEDAEADVEAKLKGEFEVKIKPAVMKLQGNLKYYVAIDKDKNAITNVSLWESMEAAMQMAQMKEMAVMGREFAAMGVTFSEITNHEMLWQLPE
ncbi:MAG: hypothetical protein AAGG11_15875 [Pseudomonadota bacterium]